MITLQRFRRLEAAIHFSGYGESIDWAETITPPLTADAFAREVIYVIVNSGIRTSVALVILERCFEAIAAGAPVGAVFGHKGKAAAIERMWAERKQLFAAFQAADDVLAFCATLPWIGPVTSRHLAKNLGADVAKNDVHLQRLSEHDGTDVDGLCTRLAKATGYRLATIDTILWRTCELRLIESAVYHERGWAAATKRLRAIEAQARQQHRPPPARVTPHTFICIIAGGHSWPPGLHVPQ